MRYGKITVCLFTLLFAAVAMVLWAFEPQTETMPINLILSSGGKEETITCWGNEAGEYFLFLPSYGDLASAEFRADAGEVILDGRAVTDGMSCGDLVLDTPYSFSFDTAKGRVSTVLTVTRSKNLPTRIPMVCI